MYVCMHVRMPITILHVDTRDYSDGLIKDSSHATQPHTYTTTQRSVQYYSSKNIPATLLKNNPTTSTTAKTSSFQKQELHLLSVSGSSSNSSNGNGKSDSFSTPRGQQSADKSVKRCIYTYIHTLRL
jgi:hypothetical protein